MILALTIGLLVAGAAYLMFDRSYLRTILGLLLFGHAVNLLLFATGGTQRRGEPLEGTDPALSADPLPQAFVLTAIVIAFAIVVVMLVLAVTGRAGDDTRDRGPAETPDDDGDDRTGDGSRTENGSRDGDDGPTGDPQGHGGPASNGDRPADRAGVTR
ncbi:cation:proton antiporter subunit C [Pseudonocardia nematodicida]|uniref:Cation:proton antiporter subunit C n=1 Tax=Pseudonocardia nematodicida TaxID=1206997 RepID=A0ABV1KGP1_9PSEU